MILSCISHNEENLGFLFISFTSETCIFVFDSKMLVLSVFMQVSEAVSTTIFYSVKTRSVKGTQGNFWKCWICWGPSLWCSCYGYMHRSKLMKMYTLNVCKFVCIIYTLIKLKNPQENMFKIFLKVGGSGNMIQGVWILWEGWGSCWGWTLEGASPKYVETGRTETFGKHWQLSLERDCSYWHPHQQ